jgi:hypothetical protein
MASLQQDYPELSSEAMIELNQECGTLEASRELPMNQLMRDNMSRLAACYSAGE